MTDNSDLEFAEEKSIAEKPLTKEQKFIAQKAVTKVDAIRQKRAEDQDVKIEERGRLLNKLREWVKMQNTNIQEPVSTSNLPQEKVEIK